MNRRNENRKLIEKARRLELFTDCSDNELAEAVTIGTPTYERAGKVLVRQGAIGRQVFLIEGGTVAVERDGERIATLGAGDIAGEMAVLTGDPRCARLVAETDLLMTVYTISEFDALLEAAPSVRARVYGGLDIRVREIGAQPTAVALRPSLGLA